MPLPFTSISPGPKRARPDKAHVAAEDVPELRQLVHRRRAHEPPDARHARIVFSGLNRARARFGIDDHRAELQRVEAAAALADALLREEHRAAVFDLDRARR